MFDTAIFLKGLTLVFTLKIFLVMFFGLWVGLIFGVIPGLTGSLAIAVLLPITFMMDPLPALAMLTAVYTGGLTGGGITAILINVPGTPGAVATVFDGYPLTLSGRQNEALGMQVASSVFGGLAGYAFLLLFLKSMVMFALKFGPSEMIFLTVLILIVIGSLGGGSIWRSLAVGLFGLLLGTIGTSEATGITHGTMGFDELEDGIPMGICIIAMFAVPEMLDLVTRSFITEAKVDSSHDIRKLLKGASSIFKYSKTLVRSALLGIGAGVLPGIGSTLACLLSYAQAKKGAKPGQRFGKGEPEGVVAAETANNASEGGAMATLLAIGIPGSGSTAILIAAFMLQGLVPGPRLLRDNGPLIYGLISANMIQMVLLFFLAILVAFYMARVIYIPTRILAPVFLALMAIGTFSLRNTFFDVDLLFFFGVLSWFLRRNDFPVISFMIGIILGGRLEMEIYRYAALFGSDLSVFVKRPISAFLMGLILLTLGLNIYRRIKSRGTAENGA